MVRLHIRGADANYRGLRHLSILICGHFLKTCIIKPMSIFELRKKAGLCNDEIFGGLDIQLKQLHPVFYTLHL